MKIKYLIHDNGRIYGVTYTKGVAECLARNCNASIEEIEILEEGDLNGR